jgi:DNA repair protein RadC
MQTLRYIRATSHEWMLVPLRETAPPNCLSIGDQPSLIAAYARAHLMAGPCYKPSVENFWVVLLNTRNRILGHLHVSTGTLNEVSIHARDIFKPAILADAAAIVLCHNHPSGDPSPSDADIKITRDLFRAGQVLRIQVMDHIIIGHPANVPPFSSMRESGQLMPY